MSGANKVLVIAWKLNPSDAVWHLQALADKTLIQPQARYLKLEDCHQIRHTATVWLHGPKRERYLTDTPTSTASLS